ncbi:MAG: methyltransferase domain-containing protein [bacterium]|nr:methyltransferase domain-containing protein [bacterium]
MIPLAHNVLEHERFPRSSTYDPDWVLDGGFGSHPLWLVEWLCETLELRAGQRVLDLGCGRAKSSIFLAREFGVEVWAADLWVDPTENAERIARAELSTRIHPIHADARDLPFSHGSFDAIVSADAFQYFGTDDLYLNYVLRFLAPRGRMGIASTGLVREMVGEVPGHLREFWTTDCWCLHTASWWRRHWARTGLVDVECADSMPDGWRVWREWCRVNGFDEWVETLEADAGRNLAYVRVVARRLEDAVLWDPPRARSE